MGLPEWTWPDWRKAEPGTRFRHVRTGATGTLLRPSPNRHNGAIVRWDWRGPGYPKPPDKSNFVTIALDAEPLP